MKMEKYSKEEIVLIMENILKTYGITMTEETKLKSMEELLNDSCRDLFREGIVSRSN
jgi:hypothetical protein